MALGVFPIRSDSLPGLSALGCTVPAALFAQGPLEILDLPAAAILSSRSPRDPATTERLVNAVKTLFRAAQRGSSAVASSFGVLPYALVSRMACAAETPLVIVCDRGLPPMDDPRRQAEADARSRGLYDPLRTLVVSSFSPGHLPSYPARCRERDRIVAALASRLLVIHARRGGNMETAIKAAENSGVQVEYYSGGRPAFPAHDDNTTSGGALKVGSGANADDHGPVPSDQRYSPQTRRRRFGKALELTNWPEPGERLIHYTRSRPGPWPGQTIGDYCQSLLDGRPDARHTAFDALTRILEEQLVRGGDRLTRDRRPVVSFTECLPSEIAGLIKWRKALIRWSFEPYGLCIGKETLRRLGASPVIYGTNEIYQELPEDCRFRFQLRKTGRGDWSAEKEWRLPGDLALNRFRKEEILVIVQDLDEARTIRDRFGYPATLARVDLGKVRRRGER
jgi:hypothetical protein